MPETALAGETTVVALDVIDDPVITCRGRRDRGEGD